MKGIDYYRNDGSVSANARQHNIDRFNDPNNKQARLFLLSKKACSLGVNLVGANRLVLFDVSWNPGKIK